MSNSKVSYMGVGGIDPIAEKKRVVFRPDSSTDTIRVGDLVCYNWDATTDYKERSTNPIPGDDDTTYSGTSQTYNARLFIVEKPTEENVQFFAGVVATLGAGGGVDGDFIDIFVPNGAVVPVMIDQDTVLGRTIVAVRDGAYEGSSPSGDGRPIGVAMETVTANTTDALCWVKVDPGMFPWGASNADALLIDDEYDSWIRLSQLDVEYAGSQWVEILNVRFEQLAACTGTGIALIAEIDTGKVTSGGWSAALACNALIGAGFGGTGTAAGGLNAATFKIEVTAGAVLTSTALACIKLEHKLPASGITGPSWSAMMQFNCTAGANAPDYLFYAQNKESVAFTPNTTHAEDAKIGAIKIWIAGQSSNPCYIWVYDGVA